MAKKALPKWYHLLKKNHKKYVNSLEALGKAVRQEGPLDEKMTQLVQLAAATAIRSEGAVHSHVRRALEAGANAEEITHAIMLLTSTVGFPTVSAAMTWAQDILVQKKD